MKYHQDKPPVQYSLDDQYWRTIDFHKRAIVNEVNKKHVIVSCLNCVYFDEPAEACEKFQRQRPPARVIATGCPEWHGQDEIPF